jgi:uncharacterized protein YxjI
MARPVQAPAAFEKRVPDLVGFCNSAAAAGAGTLAAMRYVMRQKLWSFGDDFTIKDEAGRDRFFVDGKALSLTDTLSFQDMSGRELLGIRQRILAWGPTFDITSPDGGTLAVVKQKLFTLMRYRFTVDETATPDVDVDLEVAGDFLAHEYTFTRPAAGNAVAAEVSKRWFTLADTYGVATAPNENDALLLACTVVIDQATEAKRHG